MAAIERSQGYDPNAAEFSMRFVNHFSTGIGTDVPSIGISGRVLRGKKPKDFDTLTDVPEKRKVVFLADSSALDNLVGNNGRQVLQAIDYPPEHIDELAMANTQFKLAVFTEQAGILATWENLFDLVSKVYPEERKDIESVRGDLPRMKYSDAMAAGGKITKVRTFLEKAISVNRLYTGNGITTNGQKEFITVNKPLANLTPYILVGFDVE